MVIFFEQEPEFLCEFMMTVPPASLGLLEMEFKVLPEPVKLCKPSLGVAPESLDSIDVAVPVACELVPSMMDQKMPGVRIPPQPLGAQNMKK